LLVEDRLYSNDPSIQIDKGEKEFLKENTSPDDYHCYNFLISKSLKIFKILFYND
jgi:hypothetical protein